METHSNYLKQKEENEVKRCRNIHGTKCEMLGFTWYWNQHLGSQRQFLSVSFWKFLASHLCSSLSIYLIFLSTNSISFPSRRTRLVQSSYCSLISVPPTTRNPFVPIVNSQEREVLAQSIRRWALFWLGLAPLVLWERPSHQLRLGQGSRTFHVCRDEGLIKWARRSQSHWREWRMDSQTNNSPPLSLHSQAVVFKNPPQNHCESHEVWGYSPTYLSLQRGNSQEVHPGAAPMTKNLLKLPLTLR